MSLAGILGELKAEGAAILVVDHRLYWLKGLVDEVLVMQAGAVAVRGPFSILDDENVRRLYGLRQAEVADLRPTLPRIPTALGDGTVPAGFFAAEHVSFTYKGAQKPIFSNVSFSVPAGITALIGANGIGKTTLLKSLLGLIPALGGGVEQGENLMIGYFEQEIKGENKRTCIEEIWEEFPAFSQYEVRAALARCGLTTKHIESQVRVLSGGEQAKVRLCKLMNRETNVLLLDEPTNHLDVDAKEELKRALKKYRGTVLLICHEPEFYQDIVGEVWDCSKWTTKIL